jgi:VWFA-related protein
MTKPTLITRRSLLLTSIFPALAQETTFSTDVNVVTLLANVRDKDGGFVKDLTQDDFVLKQDGKPQTIRYFSRESGLPLTIGLLVDTSRSQTGVLAPERRASDAFLAQMLREGTDQAFIAHFDVQAEVLEPPTSSRAQLEAALGRLRIPPEIATLLFTSVRDCSENVMRKAKGRKAFIILSDGVAYRDDTSITTAIEFAQRADTIIYSIRFADPIRATRPGRAAVMAIASKHGKDVLKRLGQETGGAMFEVSQSQPIEAIYRKIEDSLRNQYSLGFTPEPPGPPGKYHKISLALKRKGLTAQTRDGYYGK